MEVTVDYLASKDDRNHGQLQNGIQHCVGMVMTSEYPALKGL